MVKIVSWLLRIVVAVILFQGLFFKFTSAPESVSLFETLGMEPWGRYGTGVAELIASLLVLLPRTKTYGALMALALMIGAIGSHLLMLGIEVAGDGGLLFSMAVTVFAASVALLFVHREELILQLVRGPVGLMLSRSGKTDSSRGGR